MLIPVCIRSNIKKVLIFLILFSILLLGFVYYNINSVFIYSSGNTIHLWTLNDCNAWSFDGEDEVDCKSCFLGDKIREISWMPKWICDLTYKQSHCWMTTNKQESDATFYYGNVKYWSNKYNQWTNTSEFIITVYVVRDENGNLKIKKSRLRPDMLTVPITSEPKIWILN